MLLFLFSVVVIVIVLQRVQTENTLQPEQVNKTPAAKKKGPAPTESKEESTKKEGEGPNLLILLLPKRMIIIASINTATAVIR